MKTAQERLKEIRDKLSLNITNFSSALSVHQSNISAIENGTKDVSKGIALKLRDKFNISIDWLFTGEGAMLIEDSPTKQISPLDTVPQVPIIDPNNTPPGSFMVPILDQKLSAGYGKDLSEEDESRGLIAVPRYLSRYGEKIAALEVDGDSMEPTLHRGDLIVCDSCGWSGEGVYAIRMNGNGFVKRLTQLPGKVVIKSDNSKYEPFECGVEDESIDVVGRVHCVLKKID